MKYFETKIIKVKKKRELYMNPRRAGRSTEYWSSFSDENLDRLEINLDRERERRDMVKGMEKPKGNMVDGENLDKIKFPCFCSYFDCGDKRRHGEIDIVFFNGNKRFRLRELRQLKIEEVIYCVYHRDSLESLIKDYKIHILKGKIILFEEEN